MTEQSCFRIVTRGVAVVALLGALDQLLYLPNNVGAVYHYSYTMTHTALSDYGHKQDLYLLRDYLAYALCHVVATAIMLWVARAHVLSTKGVRSFYGMSGEQQ